MKTKDRYQLMKEVFYYLTKHNMVFCFLENGEMLDIETCKDYIADNHLSEYDKEV